MPQWIGDFDLQFDVSLFWPGTFANGDRIQKSLLTDISDYHINEVYTQTDSIVIVEVDQILIKDRQRNDSMVTRWQCIKGALG